MMVVLSKAKGVVSARTGRWLNVLDLLFIWLSLAMAYPFAGLMGLDTISHGFVEEQMYYYYSSFKRL
jgi:hypothetical protein